MIRSRTVPSVAPIAVFVMLWMAGGAIAREPGEAAPSPTPIPVTQQETELLEGLFRDGFEFKSSDGANLLRIGASFHLDARAFLGDSAAPNSFDIRRARVDLRGRLRGWMTYRIQASLENNPYIRNAWLDLRFSDALHLRAGQMKVPFSTAWLTRDNQVNFVERPTSAPVYPFFDRGLMLWGRLAGASLTYQLGAFNGSGLDLDTPRGDVDNHKDVALRLFAQPFRNSSSDLMREIFFVGQGTYGPQSVPSRRFESGGLKAPNYESRYWRWRLEQVIGTDGRSRDAVTAEIGARSRWGAEAIWLAGPFAVSCEYLVLHYDGIVISHDYVTGSNRLEREPQLERAGDVRSASVWVSYFLTGEHKTVDAFGWKQPAADSPVAPGSGGTGAWELLARLSTTSSDRQLFDSVVVAGYTADDLAGSGAVPVGEGQSVRAAVLDGVAEVVEATLGVNWTLNPNLRLQLNFTFLWVPDPDENGGILSGGNSDLGDPVEKNRKVDRETSAILRLIFRF